MKLQRAAITFLTMHLITNEERVHLQNTFAALDKNSDGKLSKDELMEGFRQTLSQHDAEEEVKRIMENADTDNNGYIDYSEFITATVNKRNLLSKEKLKQAFSIFDRDQNGFISAEEIRQVLDHKGTMNEKVWEDIIKEVDINGDGEISYPEFEKMME